MRVVQGLRTRGRIAALAAVAVIGAITIAGCTSGSSANSAIPGPSQGVLATGRVAAGADGAAGTGGGAAAGDAAESAGPLPAAGQSAIPIDGSKVIRTAELSVRLEVEPAAATTDAAADRAANAAARAAAVARAGATVRSIATAAGGFQASADGGGSQLTVSLRVPADQYDAVLDKLAAVGEVTSRTESSQDVTAQVVDVNSRVESMTASVARVRALLAQATAIAEVISIESELSVREANLESLQQQQAALSGQVAMSTISLAVTATTDDQRSIEAVIQQNGFITGLNAGWAALVGFAGWVGGAVGAVLPFLPLLAAVAVLGWWLLRRTRRRRAAAPVESPGPAAQQAPDPAADPEPEQLAEPAGAGSR